jgi:Lamin Tail Domain/Esterase-like activity of phytase
MDLRPRLFAITASLTIVASVTSIALATPASAAVPGQIVITEWMYNPAGTSTGEFIELTNIGGQSVDMAPYSFDDDSRLAGTVSLASLGTLAAGESALIVEGTDAAFRAEWGLGSSVKILAGNTTNLGRDDEINIYSQTAPPVLADRLIYGDDIKVPGSIRTTGKSGAPATCLALGANNANLWQLAVAGDSIGSHAAVHGDLGSPGSSPLNTCGPVNIRGGEAPGTGTTLPCNPEGPSGTGAAPAGAQPWPGSASVTVADQQCAWKTTTGPEGRDMSGLVFDPTNPNVLWGVKNKNWVFRLVKQGGLWVADTANGWGAGKQIFFPGGTGLPDSEGLTVGADGALYITTERDNANNSVALDSVLRFDPAASGTTMIPTTQWVLTPDFPELSVAGKANLGFEGITFVPDTFLVANSFIDQSTGAPYSPGTYPNHGLGLFFAALENDGKLYAYALNSDGTFHRVATIATGMTSVMDVHFDGDLGRIWALCDNTCAVSSTLLKISAGAFVPDVVYARPAGLPNVNIEGFAIAPLSTCTNGSREVVWSDDGISAAGHEGHALYSGTYPCVPPLPPDIPEVSVSILLTMTGVITGAGVIFIQRRRRPVSWQSR